MSQMEVVRCIFVPRVSFMSLTNLITKINCSYWGKIPLMKNRLMVTNLLLTSLLLGGCTSSRGYEYRNYDGHDTGYEDHQEDIVTSDNWECTDDCSGHEAGYEWASDNGISDPDDCGGKSESFIKGCEAYANEQQMEYGEEVEEYENEDMDYY